MNKYKIIQNKFKSWGINKREMPLGNEMLKKKFYQRFPSGLKSKSLPKTQSFNLVTSCFYGYGCICSFS